MFPLKTTIFDWRGDVLVAHTLTAWTPSLQ